MEEKNKIIRYVGRGVARTTEEVVASLAVPAAVVSMTGSGSYLGNVTQGVLAFPEVVYDIAKAYITNPGVRDTINGTLGSIAIGIGHLTENITTHPVETVLAALTTAGLYKGIPMASTAIRRNLRTRKKSVENKTK